MILNSYTDITPEIVVYLCLQNSSEREGIIISQQIQNEYECFKYLYSIGFFEFVDDSPIWNPGMIKEKSNPLYRARVEIIKETGKAVYVSNAWFFINNNNQVQYLQVPY